MADKIFCGSGKKKEFQNGGSITTVNLDLDTLEREFEEHGFTTNSGKRTIKIKVYSKRDGEDQYGNTHNVEVDTWKPDNAGNNNQSSSRNVNDYDPNKDPNHNNSNSKFGSFPGGNSGGSNFEDDIPF